jgi:hypothetical protein
MLCCCCTTEKASAARGCALVSICTQTYGEQVEAGK